MSAPAKQADPKTGSDDSQGGRNQQGGGSLIPGGAGLPGGPVPDIGKTPSKLTKGEAEDVAGSLKVHVKLNLEVDIRIIAKVKGDIAIGIL